MTVKGCKAAGLFLLAGILMNAGASYAEIDVDARVKFGNAAGIDTVNLENLPTANASQNGGGDVQVEVIVIQRMETGVSLIAGGGIFAREHKGNVNELFLPPTSVEYDAWGISGTVGIGSRASDNLRFEGRVELDLGGGKPTFSSPGLPWNSVEVGGYAALELIGGGYYTFGKPGFQIGLELGVQTFTGAFQIWNDAGYWADGKVRGSGGIANLVFGYRF